MTVSPFPAKPASPSFEVTNARGVVLFTASSADLAFGWVERNGDLHNAPKVERVERVTYRQTLQPNVIALSERRKRRA